MEIVKNSQSPSPKFLESNTDSTRALASIQVIDAVEKHNNADTLELATILGWQVVTRTGEVAPGTKVIYCEIDSMLPVDAQWLPPAVKSRIEREKRKDFFRVKTIKLRGELSQGLIIPITDTLPDFNWGELEIGHNVTSVLNVEKYEPAALEELYTNQVGIPWSNKPNTKDNFPVEFVNKTDEPRVQSSPKLFKLLQGNPYYIAVKLDGMSATYMLDPSTGELIVCSRNMKRAKPENVNSCPYWSIASKYDIENKLKATPHLAIQGEICGPKIQKNLLGLKKLEFAVFNVVDIRDRSKLCFHDMCNTCLDILSLPLVPIEETGDSFSYESINMLLKMAEGTYTGTKNMREGLVIRSLDQSISFKAINNSYLLKHGW